jgi:Ca2+-binding EF-hand superfamily protein
VKSNKSTRVTVVVAEAAESPTNLSVHVVQNRQSVAAGAAMAGCPCVLAPGPEVIAFSTNDKGIPSCTFELPASACDDWPVFIVPSAAHGEAGPFTMIVDASTPVDLVEVKEHQAKPWKFDETFEIEWSTQRPNAKLMGGGRSTTKAPVMSWYRNPQFRVRCLSMDEMEAAGIEDEDEVLDVDEDGEEEEESEDDGELPEEAEKKLQDIFRKCDVGRQGNIDKKELKECCKKNGDVAEFFSLPRRLRPDDGSMEKMERVFSQLDVDGDGDIVWEEFVVFYKGFLAAQKKMKKGGGAFFGGMDYDWGPPGTASTAATASGSPPGTGVQGWKLKDRVKVRDNDKDKWKFGEITQLAPLMVKADGAACALRWVYIEVDESRIVPEQKKRVVNMREPLLLAVLVPLEGRPVEPSALHIIQNKLGFGDDKKLVQNFRGQNTISSSGAKKLCYDAVAEMGAACRLKRDPEGGPGEMFFVIPSLKDTNMTGKFTLQFLATEKVYVERME